MIWLSNKPCRYLPLNATLPLSSLLVVHCSVSHQGAGRHHWRGLCHQLSTFGKVSTSFGQIWASFCQEHCRSILDVSCTTSRLGNHGDGRQEIPASTASSIRTVEGLLAQLLSSVGALVCRDEATQAGCQS